MNEKHLPSVGTLARREDPLSDTDVLLQRLTSCTAENRYLEWKLHLPTGPSTTPRTKYRTVKAILSFANTDGGFVVSGVKPNGEWVGVDKDDLKHADPAKIIELVNGCVFPDVPNLNYAQVRHKNKVFAIIHVPRSPLMPHVTTKPIRVKGTDGKEQTIIAKHAVYSRHGAKSDLATPSQHQKIIANRTDFLRSELLARIREVPVPVPVPVKAPAGAATGTTFKVARITDDPSAPAVRLTRSKGNTAGIFLHEELSDGLFDEINNLLEANALIAEGRNQFLLGEPVYYRIYAERQHVLDTKETIQLLMRTATHDFYAPHLYWLTKTSPEGLARILTDSLTEEQKYRPMYAVIRLATLLGRQLSDWLFGELDKKWKRYPQKPQYFWAFQKIRNRTGVSDVRLLALRTTSTASLPKASGGTVALGELLRAPNRAVKLLSEACISVFNGQKDHKSLTRKLDILAYGTEVANKGGQVAKAMIQLGVKF